MSGLRIRQGHSVDENRQRAIREFVESILQPDAQLVMFFAAPDIDPREIHQAISTHLPKARIVGCSTSGELGLQGYSKGGISGMSLASEKTSVSCHLMKDLDTFDHERASQVASDVSVAIEAGKERLPCASSFGMILIDGLSVTEEQVIAKLHHALPSLPLVGGSAGDNLEFKRTWLFLDEEYVSNAAVLVVVTTQHKFYPFKTQHFVPSDKKMVITKADAERRIVHEINGDTAARQYAEEVGLEIKELEPMIFSKHPVVLSIGGEYYVRSVLKVNEDESLTFYCAIDEGLVLTLSRGLDIVENLEEALTRVHSRIAQPKVIIGFECVLRRLEVLEKDLTDRVGEIMRAHKMVGFHTYGEQFDGIHINQTLTGVALGD